jgi:UDP-N-acetylglucosamine--N-acetylmuramyl-(pentapeptide) pyrophosphoryl-undecaprenol N-acetylglucosamine transferase
MVKIVMTGGHAATTALATFEELNKEHYEISWIGSKYAVEGKKALSLEFKIFPDLGIKCYGIYTGRLQKRFTKYSVFSAFKIPTGFLHAFYLLSKLKPDLVLSFGGFAAFPVVFSAWVFQIPVIVHEQTSAVGLANKISAKFATKIAVSRKTSVKYFNKKKVIVTGNPILLNILKVKDKKRMSRSRNLYITGGSRGSQILNEAVSPALDKLLKKYVIYHQTGQLDYKYFKKRRSKLSKRLRKKYFIYENINPLGVGKMYEKADIVIGRAGANSVSEVILTNRPAILIPIPWSRFDEQNLNAKMAETFGIADILNQNDLNPDSLINKISEVTKNWTKMVKDNYKNSKDFIDRKAALNLFNLICETIEKENY